MTTYKVYTDENYLVLQSIEKKEFFYGLKKDVFVDKCNKDRNVYQFFNVRDFKDHAFGIEIDKLFKKDGSPYTAVEFEAFYKKETGGSSSSSASIPSDPSTSANQVITNQKLDILLAELKDDIALSETVWFDKNNPSLFYIRRLAVSQDTGLPIATFYDLEDNILSLVNKPTLVQATSSTDFEFNTTMWEVIASGGGYDVGDIIEEIKIINAAKGTVSSTIWQNKTTDSIITSPVFSHLRLLEKTTQKLDSDNVTKVVIEGYANGLPYTKVTTSWYNNITKVLVSTFDEYFDSLGNNAGLLLGWTPNNESLLATKQLQKAQLDELALINEKLDTSTTPFNVIVQNSTTNGENNAGVSQLNIGTGVLGWLSGIFKLLSDPYNKGTTWFIKITDGINNATVKPSNVAPLVTDTALVTALSPNGNTVKIGETIFINSPGNTSVTQLAASVTFPGVIQNLLTGKSLIVSANSDQPYTISILQYNNATGTQLLGGSTFTRLANQPFNESIQMNGDYAKVTVQNTGAITTTAFFVNTYFGDMPASTTMGAGVVAPNTPRITLASRVETFTGSIATTSDTTLPAGQRIKSITFTNDTASRVFLQIFNKTSALVAGDVPQNSFVIRVPANSTVNEGVGFFGESGILYGTNNHIGISSTLGTYTPVAPANTSINIITVV